MESERILDALLAGSATSAVNAQHGARQLNFVDEVLSAFAIDTEDATKGLEDLFERDFDGIGDTLLQLARKTRVALGRTPGPASGALLATTGLLLHSRRRRGLIRGLVGLGGHVLISGLALKGYQKYCHGESSSASIRVENVPRAALNPANASEADSLLFARAMIAAIDTAECSSDCDRSWIFEAFRQCGIDSEAIAWLNCEFAKPASIDDLAAQAPTTEKAARIYSAVRLAIEPDTPQALKFINRLATATNLDPLLKANLDEAATELKSD